jgi:DNA-binding transcriptional ArsR family regulator
MVKYNSSKLDSVFSALADKTRRGIVADLSRGTASASELAAPHQMSLPAISKHLKILERANLIQREIQGRTHEFRLQSEQLNLATSWIEDQQVFWEMSLMKLENFLQQDSGEFDD